MFLTYVLITLSLILGIISGEHIARSTIGAPKNKWIYLLEIVLFVFVIVAISRTMQAKELRIVAPVNFLTGFFVIIVVRFLTTASGFLSKKVDKKVKGKVDREELIIGMRNTLKRKGFEEEEIKRMMKEVGFTEEKVEETYKKLEEIVK